MPVMVKSAVHEPKPPSMTGTDLGSGVCAKAAVEKSSAKTIVFICSDYKRLTTSRDEIHQKSRLSIVIHDEERLILVAVGVTGTGYYRSLLTVESAPYNF